MTNKLGAVFIAVCLALGTTPGLAKKHHHEDSANAQAEAKADKIAKYTHQCFSNCDRDRATCEFEK